MIFVKNYSIFGLIFFVLFISCVKELTIDIPKEDDRIVIESLITNDVDFFTVKITDQSEKLGAKHKY